MATRIRLRRVGRKRQASYRIVVAGSVHPRDGRATETIGKYNPRTHPPYIEINEERALHWLRQGAQMSESVGSLFRKAGILKKFAEGAAGEGVVRIGDSGGKTILASRPPTGKAEEKGEPVQAEAAAAEAPGEPVAAERAATERATAETEAAEAETAGPAAASTAVAAPEEASGPEAASEPEAEKEKTGKQEGES